MLKNIANDWKIGKNCLAHRSYVEQMKYENLMIITKKLFPFIFLLVSY